MSIINVISFAIAGDQVIDCGKDLSFSLNTLAYLESEMARKAGQWQIAVDQPDEEIYEDFPEKASRSDSHIQRRRKACRKAAKKIAAYKSGQTFIVTDRRAWKLYDSGRFDTDDGSRYDDIKASTAIKIGMNDYLEQKENITIPEEDWNEDFSYYEEYLKAKEEAEEEAKNIAMELFVELLA